MNKIKIWATRLILPFYILQMAYFVWALNHADALSVLAYAGFSLLLSSIAAARFLIDVWHDFGFTYNIFKNIRKNNKLDAVEKFDN